MRDYIDCKNAMKFDCFQFPRILEPYSAEMEKVCREKLKMHKVRMRSYTFFYVPGRHYEVLLSETIYVLF